jgi:hypothetical protein
MSPFPLPILDAFPEPQASVAEDPACPLIILVIVPQQLSHITWPLSSTAVPSAITVYASPTLKMTINLIHQPQP